MATITSANRDHELRIDRALKHLHDLQIEHKRWLDSNHHRVRSESDPKTTEWWFFATAEQPPRYPISLLIGDCLHNLRAGLDCLAFELASSYTHPLTPELAEASEFPIFGDESKRKVPGSGPALFRDNGRPKIAGWDPAAQAVVERLQPYQRGNAFRDDPLWQLHELDRLSKHRLLHTVIAHSTGALIDLPNSTNVKGLGDGLMEVFGGTIETDTPVARMPRPLPINPNAEMDLQVRPALYIAFAEGTPDVENEPVLRILSALCDYARGDVVRALGRFL